jgi:hypothetical protein
MAVSMPTASRLGEALASNLVSPARGLLIFTPVFVFSIISLVKRSWTSPLAPWLASLALAHYLLVSTFVSVWWAGHAYGPRYLTDMMPVLALALIPFFARWDDLRRGVRVLFLAAALLGLAIHLRGGWSGAVHGWNVTPSNVDDHPERVWDWHDPPFLR